MSEPPSGVSEPPSGVSEPASASGVGEPAAPEPASASAALDRVRAGGGRHAAPRRTAGVGGRRRRRGSVLVALTAAVLLVAAVTTAVLAASHGAGRAAGSTGSRTVAGAEPLTIGASLPVSPPTGTAGTATGTGPVAAPGTTGPQAGLDDPVAVATLLSQAAHDVEVVDSYDYRRLPAARSAAGAVTTGDFATRYLASLAGPVGASARREHTVQTAQVQKAGVLALSGATGAALLVGRIDTSTAQGATHASVTLAVDLDLVDGNWLLTRMTDISRSGVAPARPPGNGGLFAAVTAAGRDSVTLLTYTRAHFTADVERAVEGLSGDLATAQRARGSSLLQTMRRDRVDYAGEVRAIAVEAVSSRSVLLLVTITSYRVPAAGTPTVTGTGPVEAAVALQHGRWVLTQFVPLQP